MPSVTPPITVAGRSHSGYTPDDLLGDNHPEWSSAYRGTHSALGIAAVFTSAMFVIYVIGRLSGLIP